MLHVPRHSIEAIWPPVLCVQLQKCSSVFYTLSGSFFLHSEWSLLMLFPGSPIIPLTAIPTLLPATCSKQRRKLRCLRHGTMMVPSLCTLAGAMMVPRLPGMMMMPLSLCRGMTMILPSRPRGGTMMGHRYKSHKASWQELSCAILRSRSCRNLWMGATSCLAWQLGECW